MNEFKLAGTVTYVKRFDKVTSFGVSIPKEKGFNFVNLKSFFPLPCEKGAYITVVGHFQSGSYVKNGEKVYTHDIIADDVTIGFNK